MAELPTQSVGAVIAAAVAGVICRESPPQVVTGDDLLSQPSAFDNRFNAAIDTLGGEPAVAGATKQGAMAVARGVQVGCNDAPRCGIKGGVPFPAGIGLGTLAVNVSVAGMVSL